MNKLHKNILNDRKSDEININNEYKKIKIRKTGMYEGKPVYEAKWRLGTTYPETNYFMNKTIFGSKSKGLKEAKNIVKSEIKSYNDTKSNEKKYSGKKAEIKEDYTYSESFGGLIPTKEYVGSQSWVDDNDGRESHKYARKGLKLTYDKDTGNWIDKDGREFSKEFIKIDR